MALLDRLLGRAASPGPDEVLPQQREGEVQPSSVHGRRDRVLAGGQQEVMDSLSAKVLHGWLQNRHQTLFPLTVNLRSLKPEQAASLAAWTAVAALATTPSSGGAQSGAAARDWLGSVGADATVLALLDAALADPPPLHHALSSIADHGLAAYAYIAALIAADARDPATKPFLDYVAVRLALPATVIRSAVRRFGR